MPTYSSFNSLGSSIQTDEIDNDAVTYAKLGADMDKCELLETLTYSGDSTKTTAGTLTAYEEYMIVGRLVNDGVTNTDIGLRFNADSGNNYREHYVDGAGNVSNSGVNNILVHNLSSYNYKTQFFLFMNGKSSPQASGTCGVCICSGGSTTQRGLSGNWIGGNATQITSITIFSGQNMTGEVKVYGRN